MPKKTTNASNQTQHQNLEELGWGFNNELTLTLIELEALKKAKEKLQTDNEAFEARLGSLDAIQKFINRKK